MNYSNLLREVGGSKASTSLNSGTVLFVLGVCRFTGFCLDLASYILVLRCLNSQNRQFRTVSFCFYWATLHLVGSLYIPAV